MLAIIALILIAIVALAILGFAAHILFSPWLLLLVRGHPAADQVRPAALPPVAGIHLPLRPASALSDVGNPNACRGPVARPIERVG